MKIWNLFFGGILIILNLCISILLGNKFLFLIINFNKSNSNSFLYKIEWIVFWMMIFIISTIPLIIFYRTFFRIKIRKRKNELSRANQLKHDAGRRTE